MTASDSCTGVSSIWSVSSKFVSDSALEFETSSGTTSAIGACGAVSGVEGGAEEADLVLFLTVNLKNFNNRLAAGPFDEDVVVAMVSSSSSLSSAKAAAAVGSPCWDK